MSGALTDQSEITTIVSPLTDWRQGDYTLSVCEFIFADELCEAGLEARADSVKGLVVVTQTCDIVNSSAKKNNVVMCPLIQVTAEIMQDVIKGRTPVATTIEHAPEQNVIVDLGRMMTLQKSALVKLERRQGFSSDAARAKFAEALQRKHGRFAFPDGFNDDVLAKLRDRILRTHSKSGSDHGKAYRSIQTVRVTAFPRWEGPDAEVYFHFVLEPEEKRQATRDEIANTLEEHLGKIDWPRGFKPSNPLYGLVTLEEMTAAEWVTSQPIDWEFISSAGSLVPISKNGNQAAD